MNKVAQKKKKSGSTNTTATQLHAIDAKLDQILNVIVVQQEFRPFIKDAKERFEKIEHGIKYLIVEVDKITKSIDDAIFKYAVIKVA